MEFDAIHMVSLTALNTVPAQGGHYILEILEILEYTWIFLILEKYLKYTWFWGKIDVYFNDSSLILEYTWMDRDTWKILEKCHF